MALASDNPRDEQRDVKERLLARPAPPAPKIACFHCPARTSDLCRGVADKDLEELFASSSRIRLKAEETLILDGDEASTVYNVISGAMRLTRLSGDGRRQILGFLFTGNYIGLTPDTLYHFNAEAVSDVELCAFDRRRLETLFKLHPAMEATFRAMAAKVIDQTYDLLFTLGQRTAVERVASFLLYLREAEQCPGKPGAPLHLPMTRTDIADFLGLTIETVSRSFTKLRTDKIIHLVDAHRVEVLRPDLLLAAAGEEAP
ncbi:MAG: helix-turn-helix domain-containing protein [Alphaproteobacteria bacterium]|nr:helix-turn-helix domain-containing protein [Alphaproteobacteria bacterium]